MKKIMLGTLGIFLAGSIFAQNDTTSKNSNSSLKTDSSLVDGSNGRALASPLSAPPFPSSDWCGPYLGGTNEAPDYPLDKALGLTQGKSRFKIYGWADFGGNLSSSKHSNAPLSYGIKANTIQLDQFILRMERQPNTIQTSHVDWGFLVDQIYGTDYRYTTAKGWFSHQLLQHNNFYGWDPTQMFFMLYVPKVLQGLQIKVGRFISPADIEAQWAPDNYLYSHSLMFSVDPYTFTGVQTIWRLNPYWSLELGVHAGNDMAPWSKSAQLNGLAMVRWVSKNNNNSFYGGVNALGNGKYTDGHDNLQMVVGTWGHRFSGAWHMMTEVYYIWQKNALLGGSVIDGPARSFYMGTGAGALLPGVSGALGAVNYLQYQISSKDYFSLRNDLLNDERGSRTGTASLYTSHTFGWSHNFGSLIKIRPEIRYERAYRENATPYDNGTKKDQYTAAMDLVVRF